MMQIVSQCTVENTEATKIRLSKAQHTEDNVVGE